MAKRNKNKLLPSIMVFALLGCGIFLGALIASPSYRSDIFAQANTSRPVQAFREFIAEKKIELASYLPAGKDHPALKSKKRR